MGDTRRRGSATHRGPASAVVGAALVLVVVLGGCSSEGADPAGPDAETPATASASGEQGGPGFLEHPEQVPDLLHAKFGEVPRFTRLTLTDSDVSLELRDPEIPENLDRWRYSGGEWSSTPVSVTQSQIDALDVTTFGPESITWAAVPGLIQQAYDGVDLEEEQIDSVSFDRLAGDPPRVYIGISGLRGSGSLLAGADGSDVQVRRN